MTTPFGENLKAAMKRVAVDKAQLKENLGSDAEWLMIREAAFDLIAASVHTVNFIDQELKRKEKEKH